jgi:chromosome segregation ATPase
MTKAYNAAVEELSTKEEVHESLKKTIIDLGEKVDKYKAMIDANSPEWDRRQYQSEVTVATMTAEMNKVKNAWMHDLEILSQVRLERDSMHTQYSLLDQKYSKLSVENSALKGKIEELKQESRANFEASKIHIIPDRNVKSATGSITRIEVDYCREIENMKKTYEQEIEKLNEELDWYKAKIETERQWSHSLELANQHLEEQIKEMRKHLG